MAHLISYSDTLNFIAHFQFPLGREDTDRLTNNRVKVLVDRVIHDHEVCFFELFHFALSLRLPMRLQSFDLRAQNIVYLLAELGLLINFSTLGEAYSILLLQIAFLFQLLILDFLLHLMLDLLMSLAINDLLLHIMLVFDLGLDLLFMDATLRNRH